MLALKEICKVRRDAVGGDTKTYAYAIVERNNKASARVVVLDANLAPFAVEPFCGTFTVKHAMLWKIKSKERQKLGRKMALREKRQAELQVAVEPTTAPEDPRILTHVQDCPPYSTIDGLKCIKEVTINGKPTLLTIAHDSITNCNTGAIVNAANEGLLGGGGIDGRICDLGGPALEAARRALPTIDGTSYGPRCKTGDAKMTIAGNLPCDKIIHAVGPVFGHYPPFDDSLSLLADAYKSALTLAHGEGLTKVAFCIISAGIFRGSCSLDDVVKTGITAIAANVYPELERVYFCAFTPQEQAVVTRVISEMTGPE